MLHRLSFRAMGSDIQVLVEDESDSLPEVMEDVPVWFEGWERILSRFRLDSELMRLNQACGQPVQVSDVLWDVFQASRWADESTNGLVTPTVMDALLQAGYDRSFEKLTWEQSALTDISPSGVPALSMVVVDESSHSICLPPGVQLDFGGIAKGWSAHQAAERLKEYAPSVVNAGGDIAISGPRINGEAWPIGVSNPFGAGSDFDVMYLRRCGVATSGRDRRNWMKDGAPRHHIIDPFTGLPAETDILRATVIGSTAMEAEAAAKAVVIMGLEKGMEWIELNPSMAGLFIQDDGKVFYSSRMFKYVRK